jgi:2,3-diketo-5-methylthio-1-phosphopentane phosphatase
MDKKQSLIIFCDFDGTFTEKDIGHRVFKHFSGGKNLSLVEDWKKGLISSRECLRREAEMVSVNPDDFYRFLDSFKLREGAEEFYRLVDRQNIPFYLVSDGTDLYIEYILKKFGLERIKYFSNRGRLDNGKMYLQFSANNSCPRCGSCKGERIKEVIGGNSYEVIFIGDGLSDLCALPYADIIFSRGDLWNHCSRENIPAYRYETFYDIRNRLITGKRMKIYKDLG